MGINTGYCTVGNSGSEDRLDYTIVGKEVVGIGTKRHRGPIVERVGAFDLDLDPSLLDPEEAKAARQALGGLSESSMPPDLD